VGWLIHDGFADRMNFLPNGFYRVNNEVGADLLSIGESFGTERSGGEICEIRLSEEPIATPEVGLRCLLHRAWSGENECSCGRRFCSGRNADVWSIRW
jgi:hypothetical protein